MVQEFGREILTSEGTIDRRALAARVFGDPEQLARLNALVHPPVIRREDASIAEFAASHPDGIAVVEAAILIETGSYSRFDKMILVTCTEEQQVERALRREGALEKDIRARISRQMPLAEKRKYADFVIDTSGEKEDTLRQTRAVYDVLRRIQNMRVLRTFFWAALLAAGFVYITGGTRWDVGQVLRPVRNAGRLWTRADAGGIGRLFDR